MSPLQVLLVDDDDDYWAMVQSLVQRSTFRADVSFERLADGPEALAYLGRAGEVLPDLVLLDQRMPRMDGTEVLEQLRSTPELRSLQVCMMTSSDEPWLAELALSRGARFCITKPMEFAAFSETLGKIVDFYQTVAFLPTRHGKPH